MLRTNKHLYKANKNHVGVTSIWNSYFFNTKSFIAVTLFSWDLMINNFTNLQVTRCRTSWIINGLDVLRIMLCCCFKWCFGRWRGLLAEKLSVPWICVWISFYLGEMFVEEKLCQILACFCFLNELYCKSNLHPRIYNLFSYYIIY